MTLKLELAQYDVEVLKSALKGYLCKKRNMHETSTAEDLLRLIKLQELQQSVDIHLAGKTVADTIRIKRMFSEGIDNLKANGIAEIKNAKTEEVWNLNKAVKE